MGDVVDIASRQPHMSGRAKCTACGNDFVAVAPLGTMWLRCPECETERALYVMPVMDLDGATGIFRCECGNEAWGIHLRDGDVVVLCVRCGKRADPWS